MTTAEQLINELVESKYSYKDRDSINAIMSKHAGTHQGEITGKDSTLYVTYSFKSKADAAKALKAAQKKHPGIAQDSMKGVKAYYNDPSGTKRVNMKVSIPGSSK